MKLKILIIISFLILLPNPSAAWGALVTFRPNLAISGQFTDNTGLSSDNREFDYINVFSLGFTAGITGRRAGLTLSYNPGYSSYSNNSENNTLRHSANLNSWWAVSKRTKLSLTNGFSRRETPGSEDLTAELPEELGGGDYTIRKGRKPYNTNSTGLSMNHRFGKSDSFHMNYVYSFLHNEDPDLFDNSSHAISAGVTYGLIPPRLSLDINSSLTKGIYENPENDFDNINAGARLYYAYTRHLNFYLHLNHSLTRPEREDAGYRVYDPAIGVSYRPDKYTQLGLRTGYFMQLKDKGEDTGRISVNFDISRSKSFPRGSLKISGGSGYKESRLGNENLGLDLFYILNSAFSYGITKRIKGNVNSSLSLHTYENTKEKREDLSFTIGAGLAMVLTKWMSLSVQYSFNTLDSSDDDNNYSENTAQINLSFSPASVYKLKNY